MKGEGRSVQGEDEGGKEEGPGEEVKEGVAPLSNINTDGNHLCLNKRTGPHSAQAEPPRSLRHSPKDATDDVIEILTGIQLFLSSIRANAISKKNSDIF